eukprot:scaffold17064_cov30-Cyclotella_meneghiniana.AAC.2
MVTATAAELLPLTPPSVDEAFVMVLVEFGVVWGGWGCYLEAAGHGHGGGCVVCWAKNGEKRALSSKNLKFAPMVFKTTTGESRALGL